MTERQDEQTKITKSPYRGSVPKLGLASGQAASHNLPFRRLCHLQNLPPRKVSPPLG